MPIREDWRKVSPKRKITFIVFVVMLVSLICLGGYLLMRGIEFGSRMFYVMIAVSVAAILFWIIEGRVIIKISRKLEEEVDSKTLAFLLNICFTILLGVLIFLVIHFSKIGK